MFVLTFLPKVMCRTTCLLGLLLCVCLPQVRAADDFRTWTDISGKFKVEAQLQSVENDKAVLIGKDGKRLAIPLARLSEKDRGYLEAKMGSTPFEVLGDASATAPIPALIPTRGSVAANPSGSKPLASPSNPPAPAPPKELHVDFQSVPAQAVVKGSWSVKPDVRDEALVLLKPLDLPASKIEREEATSIVAHTRAKRFAASYSPNDPWKKERNNTTRMVIVDAESGKVLGNASGLGRWVVMDIHDDGETLVVANKAEGTEIGQLGTVQLRGTKINAIDLWRPYEELSKEAKEKEVTFAKFANDDRLVTVSQAGNAVVWNFATKEPISRFDYHGACRPSLSPNRKQLGFSGGDLVGFYDVDTGQISGAQDAPLMNYWLRTAYSPSGQRFAAATLSKIMVWEVASGDVVLEGSFEGIPTGQGLQFPDEDFLLVSNDYLIDLKSRVKLWQFVGTNHMTQYGSTPVFGVNAGGGMRLLPTSLPTPEAVKMLSAALTQPDLFVWRKGIDVRLDVAQVPPQYQAEVTQGLQTQMKKMNCTVKPTGAVTVRASITGPKAEAISYFFGGNFVFQQYASKIEIIYGDKAIWTGSSSNVPGAISRGSKEEMQKQLDDAGGKPNVAYFANVTFPQLIQKPDAASTAAGNRQTLGMSRVTASGLQPVK